MKRRSSAGSKPIKALRGKASGPKRRSAPKAAAGSNSSRTGGETEVARLARELNEAREQQTATSEVLQVISSFAELDPVFQAIVTNATRLCEAKYANLYLFANGAFQLVSAALALERLRGPPIQPTPGTGLGRMIKAKATIQITDVLTDQEYPRNDPLWGMSEREGVRTLLCVPMIKESELIGAISIFRQEVRPFTDKQIELVKNFAAQAVIAIENARLLNELRQRTDDLTEALRQQTATSEVLSVISSSPGELQPVFDTMLAKATHLCEASFGVLVLRDSGTFRNVAMHNPPPVFAELRRLDPVIPAGPLSALGRMAATKQLVHIFDYAEDAAYKQRDPATVSLVERAGARTLIVVPMLKEKELIGAISIFRQEVRPFTEKQIELVQNFAAQAVIAIENARLLNELRQRTDDLTQRTADLTEALGQQTATSEVLRVISSFPGNPQPVFAAMLENAVRICGASFGGLYRWDGDALHLVATHDTPVEFAEYRKKLPLRPNPKTASGRMVATKTVVHVANVRAEPAYIEASDPAYVAAVELGGSRTVMAVPMLKEDVLIGAILMSRQEVRPFTDKQIELVKNFAAQAVIAIENARLLDELRQSLEQQTATANVLEVISRSAFDLHAVFKTVAESSVRLCGADRAFIFRFDGETLRMAVAFNSSPEFEEWVARHPIRPGRHSGSARAALERRTIHIPDVLADPEYVYGAKDVEPIRTVLGVPILKGDELLGVMMIYHLEVRPFTDQQIALVETFADQAAIAIENVRLLEELRKRTGEVEKLNQQLEHRVADQVGEIERMGRLRRFLPPQVADLIVASGTEKQLESHRREITALFCDLRGFTGFSESSDPEDVMALLRDYHAAIGEIIIKYSGTLERYAGDGVMVVFNDPVPVEQPALQAVLMALEMREVIGTLTEKWRRLGHDIGFGIGIAHGFATLGTIGFEGRFDYAAIGTVSNVASRLCDEAKPGQILISPRVLMAVEDAVIVEPVGEFMLKGIRRPLAAYNVLAAKAAN
jgi:GAF domain-containing protein/class 3 adenylate cyclase